MQGRLSKFLWPLLSDSSRSLPTISELHQASEEYLEASPLNVVTSCILYLLLIQNVLNAVSNSVLIEDRTVKCFLDAMEFIVLWSIKDDGFCQKEILGGNLLKEHMTRGFYLV